MNFLLKYRKNALIISWAIFGFFLLHIIWIYIYSNWKYVGLPGGSVQVAVVGDINSFEPLNPLLYGSGKINDLMYSMMFRGLIEYNSEKEIYQWDLANCDITDTSKISCQLREDAIWSDWSKITNEDIVASIGIFGANAVNKNIATALKNAKISVNENIIKIESPNQNPYIVQAMSYPILRTDNIDQIKNNRLKKENYITSGPFIYDDTTENSQYGYHTITLKTNPNYKKTVWLEKFQFRIFKDIASLNRTSDTYTAVIPPTNQEKLELWNRFKNIKYSMYEYYGIFFHTDKIAIQTRNFLHKYLANKISESGPKIDGLINVNSIFQTGASITGIGESLDFEKFMSERWYKKKNILLAEANNIETTVTNGAEIPKLKYFTNGGGRAVLFSDDPKMEILLNGTAPNTTTSVIINGYTLQEYQAGSTHFGYRISQNFNNFKIGKNVYNLELKQQNGTSLRESLTIYYTTDKDQMEIFRNEVENQYLALMNSPEKISEREKSKSEKIAKIEALKDNTYYNEKLEPFVLKFAFLSDKEISVNYSDFITRSLEDIWIVIEPIPLTSKDLDEIIKTGNKNYDFIFVGVQSPGTIAEIGTRFFSSSNGGANFANVTSKNFVALFENLQNAIDIEKVTDIQNQIINFMNEQSFFLPIAKPEHNIYIDRNIKQFTMPDVISNISSLSNNFDIISIRDKYEISTENKNIKNFFSWLFSHSKWKNE